MAATELPQPPAPADRAEPFSASPALPQPLWAAASSTPPQPREGSGRGGARGASRHQPPGGAVGSGALILEIAAARRDDACTASKEPSS